MQTYIVQSGDTLYGISKQFGVSVNDIKRNNSLSTNVITVGQILKIPTKETSILYTVKRGDTLYSIARTYNTNVNEIIRINDLKTNNLYIGQQLRIPVFDNQDNNYIIYIVKPGDSLYKIANLYNVTVDKIKSLNNLSSDLLNIGQQLKIPTNSSNNPNVEEVEYETYIVKPGDSLYKIANLYDMTVDELMKINNLSTNLLSIGQILKVKKSSIANSPMVPSGKECYGEGYKEPTYITYKVKSGDNLYSIARKYNVSVDSIKSLNNLVNNNLSIGQVLKIKEV